jgi:hypothetical protein
MMVLPMEHETFLLEFLISEFASFFMTRTEVKEPPSELDFPMLKPNT